VKILYCKVLLIAWQKFPDPMQKFRIWIQQKIPDLCLVSNSGFRTGKLKKNFKIKFCHKSSGIRKWGFLTNDTWLIVRKLNQPLEAVFIHAQNTILTQFKWQSKGRYHKISEDASVAKKFYGQIDQSIWRKMGPISSKNE
jgi:hypothetical protein